MIFFLILTIFKKYTFDFSLMRNIYIFFLISKKIKIYFWKKKIRDMWKSIFKSWNFFFFNVVLVMDMWYFFLHLEKFQKQICVKKKIINMLLFRKIKFLSHIQSTVRSSIINEFQQNWYQWISSESVESFLRV